MKVIYTAEQYLNSSEMTSFVKFSLSTHHTDIDKLVNLNTFWLKDGEERF